ncbi:hypothetical protein MRX96_056557 [Rhipicephalus microplus]
MLVASVAGRHHPALRHPGSTIAFVVDAPGASTTRFDTFVTQCQLSESAGSACVPLTATYIVIAPPQTLYEPTPGAFGHCSGRIGASLNGGVGETHDGAKDQRRNKIRRNQLTDVRRVATVSRACPQTHTSLYQQVVVFTT